MDGTTRTPLIRDTQHLENLALGLLRFVILGRLPGSALTALLKGDLYDLAARADPGTWAITKEAVIWLTNFTPNACHGSAENVDNWTANPDYRKGILGGFDGGYESITHQLEVQLGLPEHSMREIISQEQARDRA